MRETLFRGFHPDENGSTVIVIGGKEVRGDWVEGSPIKKPIFSFGEKKIICTKTFMITYLGDSLREVDAVEVIPETVGQYIAKHKIFTGDICEISNGDDVMYKGAISWCEDCTSYLLTDNYVNWDGMHKTNDIWMDSFDDEFWQFKVIGNIHDKEEVK